MTPGDEIRNLLQRYARAADRRDLDALSGCFHPDAVITGARGPLDLAAWLATMSGPRVFANSMHLLADPLLDLAEAAETEALALARADPYAVVFQLGDPAADQGDLTLGIRYLDDLVVLDGRWVIAQRSATTLWMR